VDGRTTSILLLAVASHRIFLLLMAIGNTLQTGDSALSVNQTGGIALMIGNFHLRQVRKDIPNHL